MSIQQFKSTVECPTCKHEHKVEWPGDHALFHMGMHYICEKCRCDFHVEVQIQGVTFKTTRHDPREQDHYLTVDKLNGRADLWKVFPFPKNLLAPLRCLNGKAGDDSWSGNCYIESFKHTAWRWELIGPDSKENLVEKAKEFKRK